MKRTFAILLILGAFVLTLLPANNSRARVSVSVGIGTPVIYPYYPEPVYAAPPVYIRPSSYYFYPNYYPYGRRVVFYGRHHPRHLYFHPAPVYYPYY